MNISFPIVRRLVPLGVLGCVILLLNACGSGSTTNPTATSNKASATGTSNMTPVITGSVTEFPSAGSNSEGITAGPDGNLWFTEPGVAQIGRITPTGTITEFPIPRTVADSSAIAITVGPDHNLWFTEYNNAQIGRMTPTGSLTEFPVTPNTKPQAITVGPDGNLWFTEYDNGQIGRITVGKP